jgi:septum site-determining protein MinD
MSDTATSGVKQGFQLKSASVSMTALELYYFDDGEFEDVLRDKISQAPGFFKDIPLIISLEKYQGLDSELDFFKIIGTCRRNNIHVIGVRGGSDDQRRLARGAALALLPGNGQRDRAHEAEQAVAEEAEAAVGTASTGAAGDPPPAKIISQPVRSGQQIHAPEGDLVILAPVQAGAEVLAAGNIHVYGPLRGRALAGIHGAESARIFCQSLEAELVSIAGHYKISEDLQDNGWKSAVQIQLRDDLLVVTPLDKADTTNPPRNRNRTLARIIVVTSGKGGVGKTTTSASISTGLAKRGHKTVVIDFDVGLRNLDLIMNCERRVVYDFVNVIQGEATLNQALIRDKRVDTLYILPASQTREKEALTKEGVEKVINELSETFDYIVCDSPAGIEHGALMALYYADEAIVVTNPEVSSVRDSDRILGILQSKSRRAEMGQDPVKEHLLLTRYNPARVEKGEMLSVADVEEILAIPLLGVIPESQVVLNASNQGLPVILEEDSDAGQAYEDAVARLLGEEREHRFMTSQKKGFFSRMFKGG